MIVFFTNLQKIKAICWNLLLIQINYKNCNTYIFLCNHTLDKKITLSSSMYLTSLGPNHIQHMPCSMHFCQPFPKEFDQIIHFYMQF